MNLQTILTVSQLNIYVRSLLEGDESLRNVFVSGEISNFTENRRSGHMYMTIKDGSSSVKAVMFAGNASKLKFQPENGMAVIVRGRVSLYERDGAFQLYIDDMQPEGAGALSVAFEQLKEKLSNEGLFSHDSKKELPCFPQRIGLISSPSGAAVQDVINVISRRYPLAEIIFAGVPVQGEGAGEIIAHAISDFNYLNCADVIIIARGGGSAEDLWEFNSEALAREIYASKIPIVSGVGHETDFTICDFVADFRAPTPSAAAEISVPNVFDLFDDISNFKQKLDGLITAKISNEEMRLDKISASGFLKKPATVIEDCEKKLNEITFLLNNSINSIIEGKTSETSLLISKIDALSPLKVLSRGFSVIKADNLIISSVNQLKINDDIELILTDGRAFAKITDIFEQGE